MRAQATALACSLPQQAGIPRARWSCAEVATALVGLGLVLTVAASTISRWFKAERLKPWRFQLWQHSRDPRFLERATAVLTLYEQAAALLAAGVWVICVDEKSSIQAREGVDAPAAARPEQPVQLAARYLRRGAVQLFAALSVADGLVYGACRARRRFCDFQSFLEEVVVPEALRREVRELHLLLDHGPTHAPKQLEGWLAQQQATHQWPFTVHVVWLPKYASWLDQLEIWFSVLQRKLLTPNHFANRDVLTQSILDFIAHYNRSASPINWSYTVHQLAAIFATN